MDISPRWGNRVHAVAGPERDVPGVGMLVVAETTASRGQSVRVDPTRTAQSDRKHVTHPQGRGGVDATPPRTAMAAPASMDMARDDARYALARSLDRLLRDARNACRRDGVMATRRELSARVAKRIGVSQAEIVRGLRDLWHRKVAAASAAPDRRLPRDTVNLLATTILGEREREVFLARHKARAGDIAALHQLAARMAISVERVYELEASARRKLAMALG